MDSGAGQGVRHLHALNGNDVFISEAIDEAEGWESTDGALVEDLADVI